LWALKSERNREYLRRRCKEDFFFFLETFAWLYEPRPEPGKSKVIPFIPWIHQRPVMRAFVKNLGYSDMGLKKARGEGATWMCLMIILWRCLFYSGETFGVVSRNQDAADNPKDPDSLGAKLDWQLSMLPSWMKKRNGQTFDRSVSQHTWIWKDNKGRTLNSITAYPTTGNMMSGGRKTVIFADEFAKHDRGPDQDFISSVEPATNAVWYISTFFGADGAYFDLVTNADKSSLDLQVLRWQDNPYRNVNQFRINAEKNQLICKNTGKPIANWDYLKYFFEEALPILKIRGFDTVSKSKLWSPWYVSRCLRPGMTPKMIAQEYDIDPYGSGDGFFSAPLIEMLIERCVPPCYTGEIVYDRDKLVVRGMRRHENGNFRLWMLVNNKKWRPPPADYIVGCDVASGLGGDYSSNSTLSVLDRGTGRKVAEYSSPNIKPAQLAELAVAVCRWFQNLKGGPAYLIYEGNGPGLMFQERLLDTDFRNMYFRVPAKTTKRKATRTPGWWSGREEKKIVLGNYQLALEEGLFENLHEIALRECLHYQNLKGGKVEFVGGVTEEEDPSNAKENHGDRVIADALAWHGIKHLGGSQATKKQFYAGNRAVKPPPGSFGFRQQKRRAAERAAVRSELDW
jgi:hypothetical protein